MAMRGGSVVPYIFIALAQKLKPFSHEMDCLLTRGPNISDIMEMDRETVRPDHLTHPHVNKNHLFQFTQQQSGLILQFEVSKCLNFAFSFSQ